MHIEELTDLAGKEWLLVVRPMSGTPYYYAVLQSDDYPSAGYFCYTKSIDAAIEKAKAFIDVYASKLQTTQPDEPLTAEAVLDAVRELGIRVDD